MNAYVKENFKKIFYCGCFTQLQEISFSPANGIRLKQLLLFTGPQQ